MNFIFNVCQGSSCDSHQMWPRSWTAYCSFRGGQASNEVMAMVMMRTVVMMVVRVMVMRVVMMVVVVLLMGLPFMTFFGHIWWNFLMMLLHEKAHQRKNFQDDCILYWWEQHRFFIQGSGGSFGKVGFRWIKYQHYIWVKSTHPSLVTPSTTLVKFSRTKKNIVRKMCLNCGWVFKSSVFFFLYFCLDNVDEWCNWEIN